MPLTSTTGAARTLGQVAGGISTTPPTNVTISNGGTPGEYGTTTINWSATFPIGTVIEQVRVNGSLVRDVTNGSPLATAIQRMGQFSSGNLCPGQSSWSITATNDAGTTNGNTTSVSVGWNQPGVSCSGSCGNPFTFCWDTSDPPQTPCGSNLITSVSAPNGNSGRSGCTTVSGSGTVSVNSQNSSNSASCGSTGDCQPPCNQSPCDQYSLDEIVVQTSPSGIGCGVRTMIVNSDGSYTVDTTGQSGNWRSGSWPSGTTFSISGTDQLGNSVSFGNRFSVNGASCSGSMNVTISSTCPGQSPGPRPDCDTGQTTKSTGIRWTS